MNKSKSIQDKGWKMVFGKFRSESIPEYEARMAVEQSNPNSPEEQCADSCHLNGQPVHCQSCQPKIEDTGECECVECEIQGLDKCRVCREWGGHRYTPEVKTQQGWEEAFEKLGDSFNWQDWRRCPMCGFEKEELKQFISQEIESSKRKILNKLWLKVYREKGEIINKRSGYIHKHEILKMIDDLLEELK